MHNDLGNALAAQGRIDEAIAQYQRPWKSSPTTREPTTTSVLSWPAADRSTRPSPISRRPWRSSPTTRRPTTSSAKVLAGRGQIDEAMAHYQKALEIKPDFAEAHNNLGVCWPAADESTRPWPITGRPWKSSPTTRKPTTTSVSCFCQHAERSTRPWPISRRPWKSSPTSPKPTTTSALVLAGRGRVDEAMAHFQKALEIKPDFVAASEKSRGFAPRIRNPRPRTQNRKSPRRPAR